MTKRITFFAVVMLMMLIVIIRATGIQKPDKNFISSGWIRTNLVAGEYVEDIDGK